MCAMDNQVKGAFRWSIITVSYNSASVLADHWTSGVPDGVEWIVVDNCSTDTSVKTARELGARVIKLTRNAGFSAANNVGMNSAAGEFVAFVNPDVRVDWQSLRQLEELIDASGGIVSPQLLNPDGSAQPNGRGAPSLLSKVRNRLGSKHVPGYQVLAGKGQLKYVAWLIGAAVTGRSDTFKRIGGWDESYFLYYEDKDLSLRAWRNKVPVLIAGDVNWDHSWARATKHFSWGPWKREFASAFTFYRREPKLLFTTVPSKRNRLAFSLSGTEFDGRRPVAKDLVK